MKSRRRRGGNVRNPALGFFAGFPSPVERVGNSLWLLEFSTLSTGRHFHGVRQRVVLGAQRRGPAPVAAWLLCSFAGLFSLAINIRPLPTKCLCQDRLG